MILCKQIYGAFDVYRSDKILDDGEVLKCGNCNQKSE